MPRPRTSNRRISLLICCCRWKSRCASRCATSGSGIACSASERWRYLTPGGSNRLRSPRHDDREFFWPVVAEDTSNLATKGRRGVPALNCCCLPFNLIVLYGRAIRSSQTRQPVTTAASQPIAAASRRYTMRRKLILWLAGVTLALVPALAAAQDVPPKIPRHVQDPANAPIVNGQVILSTDGKTPLFTFTTDQNGDYKGEGIKPGTYYITLYATPGKAVDRSEHEVKFSTGTDTLQDFDLSRPDYIAKLPPEQRKALEEAKKKNAEINKENQNVGKLNDLLKQARADNSAKKFD